MVIRKEKKGDVDVYYVDKNMSDDTISNLKGTFVKKSQISLIINSDADVYTNDNKLLLKFRKNKLPMNQVDKFYDNVIHYARNNYTSNRGSASGTRKNANMKTNAKVASNVIGYMDTFSPQQKFLLKKQNRTVKYNVRECRFNMLYPEKYKELIPLVQSIDKYYKKLIPAQFEKQYRKAKQTHFKISNTSFTTITTNVNFRTTMHQDKGDDAEGFGNLTVIERGKYKGAETCLPQYGIGVNVRNGDVLFMDVHEWHGNLPMIPESKDATRLSIVCYLRHNVWKNTKGVSRNEMIKHNESVKHIRS
jgi:hypothetical protein